MRAPFLLSIAILATLFAACELLFVQRHPAVDPYACFGAGRYDAMRDGRTCE